MSRKKEKTSRSGESGGSDGSGIAIGMCIGCSLGVALGSATNNIGLWLPIGVGCGLAIGCAFDASRKKEQNGKSSDADSNDGDADV